MHTPKPTELDDERWYALMSKVEMTNDCWNWTGGKSKGYGVYSWVDPRPAPGIRGKQHSLYVHRVVFARMFGPIPDDVVIDHVCQNRACCNPAHLRLVTHKTNILSGSGHAAINAGKTHCPHGHEYTPENTYNRPGGGRSCRECNRLRLRKRYHDLRR